jgi:hypothetical protein
MNNSSDNKSIRMLVRSTISAKVFSLLAVGLLVYACSEVYNPVSESISHERFDLPGASVIGVNESEPVQILNFTIAFKGNTYNPETNTSTFSYTVSRGNDATGFNYMIFEIPACAELAGFTPSESSTITDDGIKWTSTVGANSSRNYSVTYKGKQPTGMVDATIQNSGSGNTLTKLIPGPCKGIYSISGTVYVDEDGDGEKQSREGGIGNVTVWLGYNGNDSAGSVKTSSDGAYSFDVYTGGTETVFNLSVPSKTDDPSDFNDLLSENYSPTENSSGKTVTLSNSDISGIHFGFKPDVEEIIQKFEIGDIKLKTEGPSFWADEFKFSVRGRKTVFTKAELIDYLNKIDALDLTYKFNFGSGEDNRIQAAQAILTLRGNSSDLDRLRAELLAAKLNVVSGNGAFDDDDNVLVDFNLVILKTGAAAANLLDPAVGANVLMNSVTIETAAFTASSTLGSSSDDLLRFFNGSGGGIGR